MMQAMTAPSLATAELGTILSLWAHPDDETYLSAGVMAAAADRGQRVVCVSATAGEHGTAHPDVWPPDRLERVRRWEALAAMAVLGVTEHRILGLPDGALADRDVEGVDLVDGLLDEVQPDTVLTFGPDGITYHPDHIAVGRWATEVWRRRGRPCRLLYATPSVEHLVSFGDHYEEWGVYMSDQRPQGVAADRLALRIALAGPELDRKLTALAAMASQTREAMSALDPDLFAQMAAEEAFVDASTVVR
jgi:LmbE family N-acetylglucosaminyl deacetylase